jgi:DNA (cytosine-5)-methyltransferase 1
MGVNGLGLGDEVPGPGFVGDPKLTVQQAALLQGFPAYWQFHGRKTAAYRQVGNAFPPPVAKSVGKAVAAALACGQVEEVNEPTLRPALLAV